MGSTMRNSALTTVQDALTSRIIGAAIAVHRTLGPGLLEAIYQSALGVELERSGLPFDREHRCDVFYHGTPVGEQRLDFVVADQVVVELKAVEALAFVHRAQVRTYLRATGLPIGLLVNFGAELIQVKRILNTTNHKTPQLRPSAVPGDGPAS